MDRVTKKLIEYRVEKDPEKRTNLADQIIKLIQSRLNGSTVAHVTFDDGNTYFATDAEEVSDQRICFWNKNATYNVTYPISKITMIVLYANN